MIILRFMHLSHSVLVANTVKTDHIVKFFRLAGVMAELIEQNEPTPLRKFLLNVQWGIRYIIRATPLLCAQKREYQHFVSYCGC